LQSPVPAHCGQDHGTIGLTKTKAFKRVFVHWAVEQFDWPGFGAEEMFRYNKVINEYEFPPLPFFAVIAHRECPIFCV